jgi:hypothetical protein
MFCLNICRVLWSKPIPLAWYFNGQWERKYGSQWSREMCNEWITDDRYLKNFAAEIPQCPCTLAHALADKGRFLHDYDCDKDSNPSCFYHRGAVHCVRSGAPRWEGSPNCQLFVNNLFLLGLHYQCILKFMTKMIVMLSYGFWHFAVWYVGTHVSAEFYPEVLYSARLQVMSQMQFCILEACSLYLAHNISNDQEKGLCFTKFHKKRSSTCKHWQEDDE